MKKLLFILLFTLCLSTVESYASTQCLGIAASTHARCKNKTNNANGYCYQHQSQAPSKTTPTSQITTSTKSESTESKTTVSSGRCQATTKSGTQCKRSAASGSAYCWQHK